ncbi:MAG: AAA family ATPase [Methanocalculaceae archaeon]|nr:AAA family ATPase [Methanocalculaceae archaeon]
MQNYRALHDLELKWIKPFTVFLGPNGIGKSTILSIEIISLNGNCSSNLKYDCLSQ